MRTKDDEKVVAIAKILSTEEDNVEVDGVIEDVTYDVTGEEDN